MKYVDPTGHVGEILKYNQALTQYYKKPSATTYNNVLNTAASIQKQSTKLTTSSGSNNNSSSILGSSTSSNNNQGSNQNKPAINGICLNCTLGLGIYKQKSYCFVVDHRNRNYGVTYTETKGMMVGVNASVGVALQQNKAKSISNLEGKSISVGGTGKILGGQSAEINLSTDQNNRELQGGSFEAGLGVGVESHIGEADTQVLFNFETYIKERSYKL